MSKVYRRDQVGARVRVRRASARDVRPASRDQKPRRLRLPRRMNCVSPVFSSTPSLSVTM